MDGKKRFGRLAAVLDNLNEWAVRIMAFAAGVTVILIMFAISYGVIARKFFSSPVPWVIEISSYALLYITFLGMPWVLRKNGHVRVDLLYGLLSGRRKNILNLAASLLGAVTSLILFIYGLTVTVDNWSRNILVMNTLAVPKFVLLAAIPLGSLFLLIEFCRRSCGGLNDLFHHRGM
ncbi:MAG: TRAP transporter small permease [Bacillota bacterium]